MLTGDLSDEVACLLLKLFLELISSTAFLCFPSEAALFVPKASNQRDGIKMGCTQRSILFLLTHKTLVTPECLV